MFPSQLKLSVAVQETYQIYIFHIVYRKKNRAEDGVIDSITILAPLSNGFGYDCAAAAALTARLLQHCVSSKISPTITDSLIGLIIAREGGKKREREGEESREGSDKCWQYCFSNIIYSSPLWERRLIFPVITTARWEIGQSDREVRKRGNRRRMTVGKRANFT